jgi:hypothetical protein
MLVNAFVYLESPTCEVYLLHILAPLQRILITILERLVRRSFIIPRDYQTPWGKVGLKAVPVGSLLLPKYLIR